MSDLIDRQQAIDAVKIGAFSAATIYGRSDKGSTALYETVRAIKALPSAQPGILACGSGELVQESDDLVQVLVKDCISRQSVLDAIDKYILGKPEGCTVEVRELLKLIAKIYRMPSAQPVIRCKDCKFYDGRPCGIVDWYNTADDFCSRAERRSE